MFEWLKSIGGDASRARPLIERFDQMMIDGLHMYDLAANALLAGTDTEVIRKELFAADRRINRNEQKLRRQLIVHASVNGATSFPTCLVFMSIAKDAERIGDYCKNLFDLAAERIEEKELALEEALLDIKERLGKQLRRMTQIYGAQDEKGAVEIMKDAETLQDDCDKHIDAFIQRKDQEKGKDRIVSTLAFRYFKRICAHSKNIVSSIVQPVDLLDYDLDGDD